MEDSSKDCLRRVCATFTCSSSLHVCAVRLRSFVALSAEEHYAEEPESRMMRKSVKQYVDKFVVYTLQLLDPVLHVQFVNESLPWQLWI